MAAARPASRCVLPHRGGRAFRVAQRIRVAVARQGGPAGPVTVSIGQATWAGEPADILLQRADLALYQAKTAGRDRIVRAGYPVPDQDMVS